MRRLCWIRLGLLLGSACSSEAPSPQRRAGAAEPEGPSTEESYFEQNPEFDSESLVEPLVESDPEIETSEPESELPADLLKRSRRQSKGTRALSSS